MLEDIKIKKSRIGKPFLGSDQQFSVIIFNSFLCLYIRYSERDGGRSEGEYEEETRYVDRKEYDGKWADNGEHGGAAEQEKGAEPAPAKGEN